MTKTSTSGTIGSNIIIGLIKKTVKAVKINAPLASDSATIKIYVDSPDSEHIIYDGYMINRDADGAIKFSDAYKCETKIILMITGGSGNAFVEVDYI